MGRRAGRSLCGNERQRGRLRCSSCRVAGGKPIGVPRPALTSHLLIEGTMGGGAVSGMRCAQFDDGRTALVPASIRYGHDSGAVRSERGRRRGHELSADAPARCRTPVDSRAAPPPAASGIPVPARESSRGCRVSCVAIRRSHTRGRLTGGRLTVFPLAQLRCRNHRACRRRSRTRFPFRMADARR